MTAMATWNTRGLRGSTLEELLNRTNEVYLEKGLALIQKIPTPITPLKIDKEHRHITLAYFEQKSTVDYIGAVQGVPVCFDAGRGGISRAVFQYAQRTVLSALSGYDALLEPGKGGRKKELPLCGTGSALLSEAEKRSARPVFRRIAAGSFA